jgi:hypothetical protein
MAEKQQPPPPEQSSPAVTNPGKPVEELETVLIQAES